MNAHLKVNINARGLARTLQKGDRKRHFFLFSFSLERSGLESYRTTMTGIGQ